MNLSSSFNTKKLASALDIYRLKGLMTLSLKDRIEKHASVSNFKLTDKLPVITIINGRGFSKLTSLLDKPFSQELAQCLCAALLSLVREIDGAVFGYLVSDQIIIVSRNDQTLETQPWYHNDIQKIASVSSSIATFSFNNYATSIDLNLLGDPIFYSRVFVVPNIVEAINTIVLKQQSNFQSSVQLACFYELLKTKDKNEIKEILAGMMTDDKINLLQQECHIDFNSYPSAFKRGVACYRSPISTSFEGKEIIKYKWLLNNDLPIFTRDHSFLSAIFETTQQDIL